MLWEICTGTWALLYTLERFGMQEHGFHTVKVFQDHRGPLQERAKHNNYDHIVYIFNNTVNRVRLSVILPSSLNNRVQSRMIIINADKVSYKTGKSYCNGHYKTRLDTHYILP